MNENENRARGEITAALEKVRLDGQEALDDLVNLVYAELKRAASAHRRRGGRRNTLLTTDLLHETYLHLFDQKKLEWEDRRHFFGSAARAMRQVLVDRARKVHAQKRIPQEQIQPLELAPEPSDLSDLPNVDVLSVNRALEALEETSPRQVQIVEMRFFGGFTENEIADMMGISRITVARDWKIARLKLSRIMRQ